MKLAIVAVLALAAAPAALAEPRRALMQQTGVCDNPPCHAATGPADFSMSFDNNLRSVEENGGATAPAFAATYNQDATPAEMSCVAQCQAEQKAAGEAHKFFDWKGCQAACFPATPAVQTIDVSLAPTQAQALADLVAQQQAQQQQQQAQQAAQQAQQMANQVKRQAQQAAQQAQQMAQQKQQQEQKKEQQQEQQAQL